MKLVRIRREHVAHLGHIRGWDNLQIGLDDDFYWVRGFTDDQLEAITFRSIPYTEVFEQRDQLLFPIGARLPVSKGPTLLWSPIDRGLKVDVPDFNHNYFGLDVKLEVALVPSDQEEAASVLCVAFHELYACVQNMADVRFKGLTWVLIAGEAWVRGTPLLPLNGKSFCLRHQHIIPSGYDLSHPLLGQAIATKLSPEASDWLLWNASGVCSLIPKRDFRPLSRSSVRLTQKVNPDLAC